MYHLQISNMLKVILLNVISKMTFQNIQLLKYV